MLFKPDYASLALATSGAPVRQNALRRVAVSWGAVAL